MTTRFPCLHMEGGLFAADLIDQIADGTAPGQKPQDFKLSPRTYLSDEIAAAWIEARSLWTAFQHRLERLAPEDPATSITRDQWIIPFLSLLDYELTYIPKASEVDGQTYAISHRAGKDENSPPIHIVGCRQSLDRRPESGKPRLAPHSLLQEYLNRSEHVWGIVTNGYTLRILRESHLMRRQAYIEFDIKQMMEGEKFSDFSCFFRLIHRSRLPVSGDDYYKCILEQYYKITEEQGGRVRDRLRDGVEKALKIFANGFIKHPKNQELREEVRDGKISPQSFYQQLLRLIYRFLFLMVAEERNLITENSVYREHYSISRLRKLAELRSSYSDHEDLWLGLQTTFRLFQDEKLCELLGVPPLNGDLFNTSQTPSLQGISITNREFLSALWNLSMYRENEKTPWRRINYSALDVEELGSIYESLLDFHPIFIEQNESLTFELTYGRERKSTGSYYTPPELVNELIKSTLEPVIEDRLSEARTTQEKEKAILNLKVCDPASGSGHFLLAAARRLGRELAKIRTGDDEPAPEQMRLAIRDVITHCIYGVDKNPLAVDLCKVALWMEGHAKGKPLTFLDHRIRCGDSLVGVIDLKVLKEGIPDEAFDPVTGDDKQLARSLKKQNRSEREGHRLLPFDAKKEITNLNEEYKALSEIRDDSPEQVRQKAEVFKKIRSHGSKWWHDQTACHLWTSAFFTELTQENNKNHRIPTTEILRRYLETQAIDGRQIGNAWALAQKHRFFHWPLEFPEVFSPSPTHPSLSTASGFDVILCNPPWERIKLQEQEFFASKDPEIASAPNKAARQRLIQKLPENNPALWHEYKQALHDADAQSKFLRRSERFKLTARGDINTYSVFAELFTNLINPAGRVGVVIPTGIATDDTNKFFFAHLVENNRLSSLYDFENREALFPGVHRSYKFCLLTIRGTKDSRIEPAKFAFFLTNVTHLRDEQRIFTLSADDFNRLNPNTKTCPVFRTRADAELTKKIYERVPVLINEKTGENPWGISFLRMFDMSNDSHLFRTRAQLEAEGFKLKGNRFIKDNEVWLPLYEAKMIDQYDHRFASVIHYEERIRTGEPQETSIAQYYDSFYSPNFRYWVQNENVINIIKDINEGNGFIVYKDITTASSERTFKVTIIPYAAIGNSAPLIICGQNIHLLQKLCLVGNMNSFIVDYVARQKMGYLHINFFILKQFSILVPSTYDKSELLIITPRVLELIYGSWDIKPFADDVWRNSDESLRAMIRKQWEENRAATGGHEWNPPEWAEIAEDGIPLPPFKWDENRRAILRAELDAYYARLYGLNRKQLRYILDPADLTEKEVKDILDPWEEVEDPLDPEGYARRVEKSTFPGETFRVLKEKEIRQYGEYRTRRLVLEAWDRLEGK